MRKWVLIPITRLGRQPQGLFLEMVSEPAGWGGVNYQALNYHGLSAAVAVTERWVKKIGGFSLVGNEVFLRCHLLNLNGLKAIGLGLGLAAFMQHKRCAYQKIIALGDVDGTNPELPVLSSAYLDTEIAAILALGQQPSPVPIFLNRASLQQHPAALGQQLAALNMVLKPVSTFYEALAVLGLSPKD